MLNQKRRRGAHGRLNDRNIGVWTDCPGRGGANEGSPCDVDLYRRMGRGTRGIDQAMQARVEEG